MEREGVIDEVTAVKRVSAEQIEMLMHPVIDPDSSYDVLAKGLAAGPGAAGPREGPGASPLAKACGQIPTLATMRRPVTRATNRPALALLELMATESRPRASTRGAILA